jgi:long-chain acyl-CoA synthetase
MLQLANLIEHHAEFRPNQVAVVFRARAPDLAPVRRPRQPLRACCSRLGVRKGDRVATVLANCRELLEIYWAGPAIGAVLVPLSPLLMASGLASLLRDSGAVCLITQTSMAPLLDAGARRTSRVAGGPRADDRRLRLPDYPDYAALLNSCVKEGPDRSAVGQDDLFNIMYTSGTTGLPKGIMHSHFVRADVLHAVCLGVADASRSRSSCTPVRSSSTALSSP